MDAIEIINKLKSIRKGTYTTITKSKDLGNGVTKVSKLAIRIGVAYANLAINAEKTTGGLKWGVWVAGLENLVIEHKGNHYVRVTSKTPDNPDGADTIETKYYLGDVEIAKEVAEELADAKKLKGGFSPVYNIKFENILAIG